MLTTLLKEKAAPPGASPPAGTGGRRAACLRQEGTAGAAERVGVRKTACFLRVCGPNLRERWEAHTTLETVIFESRTP